MTTSTYSRVSLLNGAQAENIYWKIEGAVTLNNYSIFNGTIICNNGALGAINTGVDMHGRALTTNGALTTTTIIADPSIDSGNCASLGLNTLNGLEAPITLYPNPVVNSFSVHLNRTSEIGETELILLNNLGSEVIRVSLTEEDTHLKNVNLPPGIYFYRIVGNFGIIQSGKLIAE